MQRPQNFIIVQYSDGTETFRDLDIFHSPQFLTKSEPITNEESYFKTMDELLAKSYDISNLMAANGEAFLKELEIDGDDVVKKMLYNSPMYVDSSNILPEQKLFLTLFHTLHYAAFNVISEFPTLSSSFTPRFRALQAALGASKELSKTVFGFKEVEFREYFNTKQAQMITNPRHHIEFHAFLDMIMKGDDAISAYFDEANDASNAGSIRTALTGTTERGFEGLSLLSGSKNNEEAAPAAVPAAPAAVPAAPAAVPAAPAAVPAAVPAAPAAVPAAPAAVPAAPAAPAAPAPAAPAPAPAAPAAPAAVPAAASPSSATTPESQQNPRLLTLDAAAHRRSPRPSSTGSNPSTQTRSNNTRKNNKKSILKNSSSIKTTASRKRVGFAGSINNVTGKSSLSSGTHMHFLVNENTS